MDLIAALKVVVGSSKSIIDKLKKINDKINYDDYRAEDESYDPEEGYDEEIRWDDFEGEFLKEATIQNGKLVIYRCIAVRSVPKFLKLLQLGQTSTEGMGVAWTWAHGADYCYQGKGDHRLTVTALVAPNNIDYVATLDKNMAPGYGESEQELVVNKGAVVSVISVQERKKSKMGGDVRGEELWTGEQKVKAFVVAAPEDTDYPYFHVSDHPETPSPQSHTGTIHDDPTGLYLFIKGKRVDQPGWKPKKYRWDAKLKSTPDDVIDLDYNELLEKAGITDIGAFIEELSTQNDMSSISHDYENWLDEEEFSLWADIGYPLLRYHFNDDRDKFASFLKSEGVKALSDPEGFTIFHGEPQVLVLDPSIIEWGEREKNVSEKPYLLGALKRVVASAFPPSPDTEPPQDD